MKFLFAVLWPYFRINATQSQPVSSARPICLYPKPDKALDDLNLGMVGQQELVAFLAVLRVALGLDHTAALAQ